MIENKTMVLPNTAIYPLGEEIGIKVNRLGALLQLPKTSGEKVSSSDIDPDALKDALATVLQPHNISLITLLFPDDSLLWTTEISGKNNAALYGNSDGFTHIKPMKPQNIPKVFASYLGTKDNVFIEVKARLSLNGLFTLLAIFDLRRKFGLLHLLSHTVGESHVTENGIQKEIAEALEHGDIRWLLPFMLELAEHKEEIDIVLALEELTKYGLISTENRAVILSAKGEQLFSILVKRDTLCGVESIFYHRGELHVQRTAFLSAGEHLFRFEFGDDATISSTTSKEALEALRTLFAPGEDPGAMVVPPSEPTIPEIAVPPAQEDTTPALSLKDKTGGWQCVCGKMNTGQFCASCGKHRIQKQETTIPTFCKNCGAPLSPENKFCRICGTPSK